MTPAQVKALAVALDGLKEQGVEPADVVRALYDNGAVVLNAAEFAALKLVVERFEADLEAYNHHYGSFMGGDPRHFTPDEECSTPEEREAHRLACAAAERGDAGATELQSGDGWNPELQALVSRQIFGLGTTRMVDEEGDGALAALRRFSPGEKIGGASVSSPPAETP